MTRAKERLIVSGSIDREKKADASTPIGWVLGRLDADEELDAAGDAPVEIERNDARLVVRVDRYREAAGPRRPRRRAGAGEAASSRSSPRSRRRPPRRAPVLPPLVAPAGAAAASRCAGSRSRRSRRSTSARTSTTRSMSRDEGAPPEHRGDGDGGLRATEIGDAVHRLLEQVDLAAPAMPDLEQVRAGTRR